MVSTPLMAFAIWSCVASAFHCTWITWITVFGFVGAANRNAAAATSTAQTAKMVLFVIFQLVLSSGIPVYPEKSAAFPASQPDRLDETRKWTKNLQAKSD